jgi:hypothetical protein
MKIKHIKDPSVVWPSFYDYSVNTKAYSGCEFPSPHLRTEKIKDFFRDLVSSCEIYMAEEYGEPLGYVRRRRKKLYGTVVCFWDKWQQKIHITPNGQVGLQSF